MVNIKSETYSLTQELVQYLFDYRDGILYWKNKSNPKSHIKIGELAGWTNCIKNKLRRLVHIHGKTHPCSRIIFLYHKGYLPEEVDHENNNPFDDRIENLRAASHSENMKNKSSHKNSSSKYLGVNYSKHAKRWLARINVNKKDKYLGSFKSEEEAALTYNKGAVKYHGEFANLNIILIDQK